MRNQSATRLWPGSIASIKKFGEEFYVSQQLRKLHILLVDGDPQARDRVQQALGNGFSLRFARSLAEAHRCLEEATPDVLVCEIVLPDASGLDVCRQIRLSPTLRHLPVMLLTTLSTI